MGRAAAGSRHAAPRLATAERRGCGRERRRGGDSRHDGRHAAGWAGETPRLATGDQLGYEGGRQNESSNHVLVNLTRRSSRVPAGRIFPRVALDPNIREQALMAEALERHAQPLSAAERRAEPIVSGGFVLAAVALSACSRRRWLPGTPSARSGRPSGSPWRCGPSSTWAAGHRAEPDRVRAVAVRPAALRGPAGRRRRARGGLHARRAARRAAPRAPAAVPRQRVVRGRAGRRPLPRAGRDSRAGVRVDPPRRTGGTACLRLRCGGRNAPPARRRRAARAAREN